MSSFAAAFVPITILDFSPGSLAALESLVRDDADPVLPPRDWEELTAPIGRDLLDWASWYLGEVVRGALGGRWSHDDDERGCARLIHIGRRGEELPPALALKRAIEQPGYLRTMYDMLAGQQ